MSDASRLVARVRKRLGAFELDVDLQAHTGTLVLFGPSGAGKTSLLQAIAGLLRPDAGLISFDGTVFYRRDTGGPPVDRPARERRVGYVMQDYALFPHLTALQNVAYPIRCADRLQRAHALLERVSLPHLSDHYAHQLSGGQQQRVAIARALAVDTRLLLLDEPFAALDGPVRERLQHDLRSLQADLGLVLLLVTHRIEDAFAMGDRIAIIRHGRIEQTGPLYDVFRRPASRGVAEIMGIRNLIRARVLASTDHTLLDWQGIRLEADHDPLASEGHEVTAYIRPEDVKILYPDRPLNPTLARNVIDGHVARAGRASTSRVLAVRLANDCEIELRFPLLSYAGLRLEPGEPVRLALRREGIVILDRA